MKQLATLFIAASLAVALASPVLAKPANDKQTTQEEKAAAYKKASEAEKQQMRLATMEKASEIDKKRDDARAAVDDKMKVRLQHINADTPGNIGPVGNN